MHNEFLQAIDLQCFRMRTERQKNRIKRKDFEKKLLALRRAEDALYEQQNNLGWMELRPPVMRGYKRSFVLREDVARSKDAAFYERILQMVNTTVYHHDKSFFQKKKKKGRYKWGPVEQHVHSLSEHDIKRWKLTPKERNQFYQAQVVDRNGTFQYYKYVLKEKWRFVLRIRPHMITRTRIRDEVIEQRLQEIDEIFTQRNWDKKLMKIQYGCNTRRCIYDF
ncbi:hypothetical protein SAMN05421788_101776 [Filimonas lacunae]|uniref:Uncharacterized protein n=1 Tax=Filimonas lacunae TaxID=477680 RepID=A0A173MPQ7_9BACT|nr:hypothetical protein [Filimonas lacunae]BAV09338.1 hypothetical protein FLA_5386 [Filimonas lacunae]SIS71357.1 hypothetical protein SAMN05421788_101776 [Filimonas lacunae]